MKSDWIETYTGAKIFIPPTESNEYRIEDIAHSLSLQCQFNGHCKFFWSIAQHTLLAYKMARMAYPEYAQAVLLHDAAEAYIGDLPRPIKGLIQEFAEIEYVLLCGIFKEFDVNIDDMNHIKPVDNIALAVATQIVMSSRGMGWNLFTPEMCFLIERHPQLSEMVVEEKPSIVEEQFLRVLERELFHTGG